MEKHNVLYYISAVAFHCAPTKARLTGRRLLSVLRTDSNVAPNSRENQAVPFPCAS